MSGQTQTIDFSPLQSPVTQADIAQSGWPVLKPHRVLATIFGVLAGLASLFIVLIGIMTVLFGVILFGVICLAVTAYLARAFYKGYFKTAITGIHAERFAAANHFSFQKECPDITLEEAGSLLRRREKPFNAHNLVAGTLGGRAFCYGEAAAGYDRSRYLFVFMRLTLDRQLPHVIIEGLHNLVSVSEDATNSQRLQLEGNFNDYFTIYCPKGYETDVLYYLTPELMQYMIDHEQAYDMEIVGNQLYFYRGEELQFTEQEQRELFGLLQHAGGEFTQNIRLFNDPRAVTAPAVHRWAHWRYNFITTLIAFAILFVIFGIAVIIGLHQ